MNGWIPRKKVQKNEHEERSWRIGRMKTMKEVEKVKGEKKKYVDKEKVLEEWNRIKMLKKKEDKRKKKMGKKYSGRIKMKKNKKEVENGHK